MTTKHRLFSATLVRHCAQQIVLIAVLGLSRSAQAQSAPSDAEVLFNEGRNALQAHDYALACRKFRESNRLDLALGTQFNLANCEEQRGHVATAWALFHEVREHLADADARIPVAEQHIAALEPRLPHLRLVNAGQSPDFRVQVDGVDVPRPATNAPIPVDPGKHRITFIQTDRPPETRLIELSEHETLELDVSLPQAPPQGKGRASGSESQNRSTALGASRPSDDRVLGLDRRILAYSVTGTGVASLLVGTITGIAGVHQESIGDRNCSDTTRTCTQKGVDANNAARSLARISTIGLAIGLTGVGVGGYLLFTAKPQTPRTPAVPRSPMLSLSWANSW